MSEVYKVFALLRGTDEGDRRDEYWVERRSRRAKDKYGN